MLTLNKLKFLNPSFFILSLCFITCLSQNNLTSFCGKIPIRRPFLSSNSSTVSSPLNHMMLCRSQKLYFRTSLGLLLVSSIDYASKALTISQPSCSSSHSFVSPSLLSAGFPAPSMRNSLLLFNCSSKNYPMTTLLSNCTHFNSCSISSKTPQQELEISAHSCLLVNDLENLVKGFHPKDFKCSHYSRVYRDSLNDNINNGYQLGTRISFDIPDHAPNICDECEKPNGNCGVGLRCVCHPKKCKDKVISAAGSVKPFANNVILNILPFIVVLLAYNIVFDPDAKFCIIN